LFLSTQYSILSTQYSVLMKKIISIIGARPQFIKYAPLSLELQKDFEDINLHTGQHYDEKMSDVFFHQLKINPPKYNLHVGSLSHGKQTAEMLSGIEEVLLKEKPEMVIVFGDTNSTLAGAIAASKLQIPVAHVEAGLRSYNKTMPEELNRIMTDHISELLFAPTKTAVDNLKMENVFRNVYQTGDLMADSLKLATGYLKRNPASDRYEEPYILTTIHRNYNTDSLERLQHILRALNILDYPVIFPIHPRTENILKTNSISKAEFSNIRFVAPLGYFEFINALMHAKFMITDSGGIQKEAYMLRIPCITVRYETEWVETLEGNWNVLAGEDLSHLKEKMTVEKGIYNESLYGTGKAAADIADSIKEYLY
jgi:UDP-GlcNAc3NAcA epimerase